MIIFSHCNRYSFIFVFKHNTAYEMRISDWNSNVCSSDLIRLHRRTIPDRLWLAVLHLRKLLVPIKQGIGWDDRSDITQNGGLGHPIFSVHTKMPRSEEPRVGQESAKTWRSRW